MNDHSGEYECAKTCLIRLGEVRTRVGPGASTVYRYLAAGKFPRPVEIGGGRVAWLESEIDAWIASRAEDGRRGRRSPLFAAVRVCNIRGRCGSTASGLTACWSPQIYGFNDRVRE